MVVLMERVAVERELGVQGADNVLLRPEFQIVIIFGHLNIGSVMLSWLSGIDSDVVLIPGNSQACPEL